MALQNKDNRTGEIIIHGVNDRCDVIERIKDGTFESVLLRDSGMMKSIIFNLVQYEMLFTVINYGGGVYRIMKEELKGK